MIPILICVVNPEEDEKADSYALCAASGGN